MTIPHFDSVRDIPLSTDADLLERIGYILDSAIRRQLWMMFLDQNDHQLPLIMPTFLPSRPRRSDAVGLGHFIRAVGDEAKATTVILTYERRAGSRLSATDRVWLRALREACITSEMQFRGPYLCHRDGVDAVPPDDYA